MGREKQKGKSPAVLLYPCRISGKAPCLSVPCREQGHAGAPLPGVTIHANKPLEERAPALREPSGEITSLQQALQVGDNPPSQAVHTAWLQLSQGHGVLLPLVRSLDLLHQDSGLQDLGEALLPSRSEGYGQTQPGRTAHPLPLGRSWPLPPPLAALPSHQRWESCRRGRPRKRCRNS